MFKFYLYKFGQFILRRVSLQTSFKFAQCVSDLQYYCSPRDRQAVNNNLKIILNTSEDLPKLTKEVFRNFGQYLVEFFRLPEIIDQDYIKQNIKIEHREKIEEALSKGKGVILVTAHIGNWELGAIVLGVLGYRLVAVALPHKERPVNDLFNNQRELRGVTVVPTNIAVRRCIEALHENKLIAIVADRDFGLNGEILDFLGRKTLIPKGPAMFSYKTGAAIVPIFLIRHPGGRLVMSASDPIYPEKMVKGEVDQRLLVHLMKKYITVLEEKIRQHPSQWLMFRKFWVDDSTHGADSPYSEQVTSKMRSTAKE